MKKAALLLLVFALAFTAFGCKSMGVVYPSTNIPLTDTPYTVLADTTGEATVMRILIFPIYGANYGHLYGFGNLWFAFNLVEIGKQNALYDALSKIRGADIVASPRYEIESTDFLIFAKHKIKVHAKALKYQK